MSDGEARTAQDEALVARLREIASVVDVPSDDDVLAARSALAYRSLDAELARLVYDSRDETEDKRLAGVRGQGGWSLRVLTFEAGPYSVEFEVLREGGDARIVGQCVPGEVSGLTAEGPGFTQTITVDQHGRFRGLVPQGPLRLVVEWLHERRVETEWITV